MNKNRFLLQVDCVRAKRGGHGKVKPRTRYAEPDDALPQREAMRRPHLHNRKTSNGRFYTVLKRYLQSRVGQPWNRVHGELCRQLPRRHTLDFFAREWVESWVLQNVRLDEAGEVREMPHDCRLSNDFYVHPVTGTLEYAGARKREKCKHKPLVETNKVGGKVRYAKQRGIWYEVTLLPIPTVQEARAEVPQFIGFALNANWLRPRGPVDVILNERATPHDESEMRGPTYRDAPYGLRRFQEAWGGLLYAARKLQLNGDELAREGLRNDV